MKTTTIRPGILVALRSAIAGGIHYSRVDLAIDETEADHGKRARWETTRTIENPEEHARAIAVRGRALKLIRKECSESSFGLLCPADIEPALDLAIEQARGIVAEFNETADVTRVSLYVLKGRVADSDEEAARAIADEVAELVAEMNSGITDIDVKRIRAAATRARDMSAMLDERTAETVGEAVKQARTAARQIVKRIEKDGEKAEIVMADIQRGALEKARIAFLDMSDDVEIDSPLPAINQQRFADLDVAEAV